MNRICYGCGKKGVEKLYYVSRDLGSFCEECAKKFILCPNWHEIDLRTLFELKDEDLIRKALDDSIICYCRSCGYFDFQEFDVCPFCESDSYETIYLDFEEEIHHLECLLRYLIPIVDYDRISDAIAGARHFINVATYSIDKVFIGKLETMYRQNVDVHVIVGFVDNELRKLAKLSYAINDFIRYDPKSHVKLVVIDGVLAF